MELVINTTIRVNKLDNVPLRGTSRAVFLLIFLKVFVRNTQSSLEYRGEKRLLNKKSFIAQAKCFKFSQFFVNTESAENISCRLIQRCRKSLILRRFQNRQKSSNFITPDAFGKKRKHRCLLNLPVLCKNSENLFEYQTNSWNNRNIISNFIKSKSKLNLSR